MKSKSRMYLSIATLFAVFTIITVMIQLNREKRHKVNELKTKMQAYAIATEGFLSYSSDTLEVDHLLPDSIRFSIIDQQGNVCYDNVARDAVEGINHLGRPEVIAANLYGEGYAIRKSKSTEIRYLYYAFRCRSGDCLRLALPYKIDLLDVFGREALMMYALSLALIVALIALLAKNGQLKRSQMMVSFEKKRNIQLKQEMTNNIAHELKTPVASIRGYLESLDANPDISAEKRQHFIQHAYRQTLRLTDLINDIGLITKLEESSRLFEKSEVNIHEVVDEVRTELELQIQESQAVLKNHLPKILTIEGNRQLLYAIFRNLVENALKYAGKGVEIVIKESEVRTRGMVNIIFYDTGKGVNEKDLERIFDRFVRLDDGRDRRTGGTGLGLSIVKHAVLFHGGTIRAENRMEGGLLLRMSLSVKG